MGGKLCVPPESVIVKRFKLHPSCALRRRVVKHAGHEELIYHTCQAVCGCDITSRKQSHEACVSMPLLEAAWSFHAMLPFCELTKIIMTSGPGHLQRNNIHTSEQLFQERSKYSQL